MLGLSLCLLSLAISSTARADGGLDALAFYIELLAVQAVGFVVGVAGLLGAVLSRSRNARVFGIAAVGLNALMALGSYVLFHRQRALPWLADYQAALALVGTAMLVVGARPRKERAAPANTPSPLSPRWVLAWVLAHGAATAAIGFAQGPIITAIAFPDGWTAHAGGRWTLALLVVGILRGGLLGAVEWILLRRTMGIDAMWIAVTIVAGAALGIAGAGGAGLLIGTVLGGALLGSAQWSVLRRRVRASVLWIVVLLATSLLAWIWTTTAVGLRSPTMMGPLAVVPAVLQSLATGLVFAWWSRQAENPTRS